MINGKGKGGMLRVDESVTSRHTFYPHIAAVVAGGADVAVCSAHVWRTALSSTRWPNQRRQDNKKTTSADEVWMGGSVGGHGRMKKVEHEQKKGGVRRGRERRQRGVTY